MKRATYDADSDVTPKVGDYLVSKAGIARRVMSARQVRSRVAPNRWAIEFVDWPGNPPDGARVLSFAWYSRGRKK